MAEKILASRLDRRITLQKPTTVRDPDTNEINTGWETVAERLPANKEERGTGSKDGLELDSAVRSEVTLTWTIRHIGSIVPKATWRLIDEYGTTHELIAPPTEVGRRQGWTFQTRQLSNDND